MAHELPPSDRELLAALRGGDRDAYAVLWERHAAAVRRAAGYFTGFDPDDVTAETFARILQTIERGHGPTDAFRPYAMSAARNIATEWSRRRQEIPVDSFEEREDGTLGAFAAEAAQNDDSNVAEAFASLPSRWQEALWYSEVEQVAPAELGTILGVNANGAANIAFRAREGLRQAWLAAHIASRPAGEGAHDWYLSRAAKYTRGKLSGAAKTRVDEHLGACESCTAAFAELQDANRKLGLLLLPLVLGSPAAGQFLAARGENVTPADHGASLAAKQAQTLLVSGVAVSVSVLLTAGIAVGVTHRGAGEPTAAGPSVSAPADPSATSSVPVAPPSVPSPGTGPTNPPASPTSGPSMGGPAHVPPPAAPAVPTTPTTPTAPTAPTHRPTTPAPSSTPTKQPSDRPTTPTTAPTPNPPSVAAPTIEANQPATILIPRLQGDGEPGATVTVTVTGGAGEPLVAERTVGPDGRWSYVPALVTSGSYTATVADADGTTRLTTFTLVDDLTATIDPGTNLLTLAGTPLARVQVTQGSGFVRTVTLASSGTTFIYLPSPGDCTVTYVSGEFTGLTHTITP